MSFSPEGVKFNGFPRKRGFVLTFLTKTVEVVLSILFIISLAGPLAFPDQAEAAAGVSKKLSYQGRLTDTNGNPLTGSYCMRFSVWDVSTGGTRNPNQLWPASYTVPTSNTVTVSNGVFNIGIGDVDDLSAFDFSANDTEYLYVEVYTVPTTCTGGSWEALTPYQRLEATAYARVAENLYGGNARIGTGTGVSAGSEKYLKLDVVSTQEYVGGSCAGLNGFMWYNSFAGFTRGLICENNVIEALSNATTTIDAVLPAGNLSVAATAITNGTVTLAGGANITLSQAGNALSIIGGGGGGGAAFSAGTQSVSTGTVNFANSNNISFGMSNSNQITASFNPGVSNLSAGTASYSGGQAIFSDANGVSFGMNNGTVTASYAPRPALAVSNIANTFSTGTVVFSAGNLISLSTAAGPAIIVSNLLSSATTASAVGTANVVGVMASRFALEGHQHAGIPVAGISGGNTSNTSGTYYGSLMFAGGNNITLSAVTGAGGQTITIVGGAGGGGLGGIAVAGSTATNGTILFSNANNVTFGMNGSTITASAPSGGGGGGATFSNFQWPPGQFSSLASSISNAVMTIVPFTLAQNLTATRAMAFVSLSGNTNSSGTYSISIALFTRNGSTLSMASSGSAAHNWVSSQTSLVFGNRRMSVPININATPGEYWYGVWIRTSNNGLISVYHGAGANVAFSGNVGAATNSSRQLVVGQGIFSNASFTTAMPGSVAITNVKGGINSATLNRQPWMLFTNFDLN